MVADLYKNPYFDSSVFLGWIKKEVVKGVNRRTPADHILTLAEGGSMTIITSTLTLVEVHKLRSGPIIEEKDNGTLLKSFERYLENEWIRLVDVDRRIGEEANSFCRQYGIYPNYAIHLACALRAKCDYLPAWDDRFSKVVHPDIKFDEPKITGQTTIQFPPPPLLDKS